MTHPTWETERTLLRWPTPGVWWIFVTRNIWLSLLWTVVYGGADLLAAQHDYRVRLHFDFELAIPFWPNWAIVYLSLFPMFWLSPFVLGDEARLKRFANSIGWLIVISGIGFVLLPSTPAYEPRPPTQEAYPAYQLADQLNLDFNMLPSLHVGMAVLCALAYGTRQPCWCKILFHAWAVAISASTLLLHQHHWADVIAGYACAIVVHRFVK